MLELERYKRMIDKVLNEPPPEEQKNENRVGGIKKKRGGEAFDIDTSDIKALSHQAAKP